MPPPLSLIPTGRSLHPVDRFWVMAPPLSLIPTGRSLHPVDRFWVMAPPPLSLIPTGRSLHPVDRFWVMAPPLSLIPTGRSLHPVDRFWVMAPPPLSLIPTGRSLHPVDRFWVVVLHSVLSSCDQQRAFTTPPSRVRKIVIATNIAETGITIPDVVFVIDSGKVKETRCGPNETERNSVESESELLASHCSSLSEISVRL